MHEEKRIICLTVGVPGYTCSHKFSYKTKPFVVEIEVGGLVSVLFNTSMFKSPINLSFIHCSFQNSMFLVDLATYSY